MTYDKERIEDDSILLYAIKSNKRTGLLKTILLSFLRQLKERKSRIVM